jgi:hypothetical protein
MMRCSQDSMCNILIWVAIYDPFSCNHTIDKNWNRLDYPLDFNVPLLFILYDESLLLNPNLLYSFILTTYILWLQQTQTAQVKFCTWSVPNRPLTSLQNPNTTEYHKNIVSFRLVYRIWRFIFIHNQQQSQFEPMKLQLLPLTKVPTLSSVQLLPVSSTHQEFGATRSPLMCLNEWHNQLCLAKPYPGAIIINSCLRIPYMSSRESELVIHLC